MTTESRKKSGFSVFATIHDKRYFAITIFAMVANCMFDVPS